MVFDNEYVKVQLKDDNREKVIVRTSIITIVGTKLAGCFRSLDKKSGCAALYPASPMYCSGSFS